MRKILFVLAILCCSYAQLCCSYAHAAPILPEILAFPDIPEILKDIPVEDDFLKAIRRFQEWSDNLDNPDFYYKRVTFRDRAGKVKRFTDLSEFEKGVFYLTQGREISVTLAKLQLLWKIEEIRIKDYDVHKYLVVLGTLRKDTAKKYEEVIEKVFKKFEDKIPKAERTLFLTEVKKVHDEAELVERDE